MMVLTPPAAFMGPNGMPSSSPGLNNGQAFPPGVKIEPVNLDSVESIENSLATLKALKNKVGASGEAHGPC